MAITWDWNTKIGTIEERYEDGSSYVYSCYGGGNCPMVTLAEWEQDGKEWHSLHGFIGDKQHLENCLKDDLYRNVVSVTLYSSVMDSKDLKMVVTLLIKYGVPVTIRKTEEGF